MFPIFRLSLCFFPLSPTPALALPFSATNDIVLSRPITRPRASFALIRRLPSYQPCPISCTFTPNLKTQKLHPNSFFGSLLRHCSALVSFPAFQVDLRNVELRNSFSPTITCGNGNSKSRGKWSKIRNGKWANAARGSLLSSLSVVFFAVCQGESRFPHW